ncbi:protein FAR-RED ELONGATED HYPOCOTYL 1 isoform X2 [Ricinus communis]|uniref:Uncharacterized protein n=2 Tax=Ricinus communis TaxID=3988 RepID=B9SZZ5_RICCO|nr:protein FAR-RED ELONGATED HYPOCOTYL 1 isoform X2 [Ricinus communis]EEF30830.1 hypothetical protein RCOM_0452240 [Ricinus communis]
MFDLNKKRKLQAEQLVLPISKHKCWDHRIIYRPPSILEENQEADDLIAHVTQENAERQAIEDVSDPESAKDSNSFVGDSESIMSVHGEAKFETEVSKQWPPLNGPSASSNCGCNNLKETQCSMDDVTPTGGTGKDELPFLAGEHDLYHHYNELHQNLEEATEEFRNHSDYMCSEHGIESIEPCTDNVPDDMLSANEANPNMFILSSGRWTVNQDAQPGTIKPTIDQEFEQYFSMLML